MKQPSKKRKVSRKEEPMVKISFTRSQHECLLPQRQGDTTGSTAPVFPVADVIIRVLGGLACLCERAKGSVNLPIGQGMPSWLNDLEANCLSYCLALHSGQSTNMPTRFQKLPMSGDASAWLNLTSPNSFRVFQPCDLPPTPLSQNLLSKCDSVLVMRSGVQSGEYVVANLYRPG
jgi:hypothetical protein